MTERQKIETAPKDGRNVLLYYGDAVDVGRWVEEDFIGSWLTNGNAGFAWTEWADVP